MFPHIIRYGDSYVVRRWIFGFEHWDVNNPHWWVGYPENWTKFATPDDARKAWEENKSKSKFVGFL